MKIKRLRNPLGFFPLRSILFGIFLVFVPSAVACLWDSDTLQMERYRFPDTLELITGKFLRHSPEFYEWRVRNRLERLKSEPSNVTLYDDLGVAYDKLGRHDQAIAMAERVEQILPGRYETAANLGTFYFHAGKFREGLPHIERAIRINPDAHFGREKYQKLLVEYMLQQRAKDPSRLPLADIAPESEQKSSDPHEQEIWIKSDFVWFIYDNEKNPPSGNANTNDIRNDAVKGVLGMMRFGNHNSPILLEALGSLLMQMDEKRGKMLAARAFLKASYEVPAGPARDAYRGMARRALMMKVYPGTQNPVTLARIENDFQVELREAKEWYEDLHEREKEWVAQSADPEEEFNRLYLQQPSVTNREIFTTAASSRFPNLAMMVLSLVVLGLSVWILTRLGLQFGQIWRRR